MAGEDAVMVVVERRLAPFLEQAGQLFVAARGADVAPAVHHMHLRRLALAVVLDDADRPGVRPGGPGELRERRSEPRVVQVDVLLARAHAGTAAELMAEADAGSAFVEAHRLEAQALGVR